MTWYDDFDTARQEYEDAIEREAKAQAEGQPVRQRYIALRDKAMELREQLVNTLANGTGERFLVIQGKYEDARTEAEAARTEAEAIKVRIDQAQADIKTALQTMRAAFQIGQAEGLPPGT